MKSLVFANVDENSVIRVTKEKSIKTYPPKISTIDSLNLFEAIMEKIIDKPKVFQKYGFNLLPVIYEDLYWYYCFHYVKYENFFKDFNSSRIVFKSKYDWQLNSVERKNRFFSGDTFYMILKLFLKRLIFIIWLLSNIVLKKKNKTWVSSSIVNDFRYNFFSSLNKTEILIILNRWTTVRSSLRTSRNIDDAITNNIHKKVGSVGLWCLAIRLLRPNKIICQDNLFDNYSLLLAAKINNIEVIGISHGLASFWHRGITGSKHFNKCKDLIKYDRYYCWLPEMKKMLDDNSFIYSKDEILVSGWLKDYPVAKKRNSEPISKFVLYPYEWLCNHDLIKLYLFELNKLGYKIIIKMRPDKENYDHLNGLNAEFIDNFSSFHFENGKPKLKTQKWDFFIDFSIFGTLPKNGFQVFILKIENQS